MADSFIQGIDAHLAVAAALRDRAGLLQGMADQIVSTLKAGGTVYTIGNGGSAADAQHIAAELLGRFKLDRPAFSAAALTTDTSTITAVANDLGADRIFDRQVEGLVGPDDLVWALSVSGTSPNILGAIKRAKEIGAFLIGFTGESGGEMAGLCDLCLNAAHASADRVQEIHVLAYHLICEHVERILA